VAKKAVRPQGAMFLIFFRGGIVMTNITMSVDETLLQQARKVALERGTSLSGMVREFLTEITQRDEEKKQIAVRELKKIFKQNSIDLSTKNWSREDLYER
jgi:hypothetical protein